MDVWYFKQAVDKVGKEDMMPLLKELRYGNCDISEWDGGQMNPLPELNGFWLGSSLKISPYEQVQVLQYIFCMENNFERKNLEVLKNIMYVRAFDDGMLCGKTGMGDNVAWFVGFYEKSGAKIYIAVHLEGSQNKKTITYIHTCHYQLFPAIIIKK